MAAVVLFPEALRGDAQSGSLAFPIHRPGREVQLTLTSPVWAADPTLTFDVLIEQSFDAGATWEAWAALGTKGGTGVLPFLSVQSDGIPRRVRGTTTVPIAFVWGVTAELLA